jgi:hypothetical protein
MVSRRVTDRGLHAFFSAISSLVQPSSLSRAILAQIVIGEPLEQALELVGDLGREGRVRLDADHLLEFLPVDLPGRPAAAALLPLLPAALIDGLAGRDEHERPPQVVAVAELGNLLAVDRLNEGMKRGQGDVLLVGHLASSPLQFGVGQSNHPRKVAVPKPLGRIDLAGLQVADPVGDRAIVVHRLPPFLRPRECWPSARRRSGVTMTSRKGMPMSRES